MSALPQQLLDLFPEWDDDLSHGEDMGESVQAYLFLQEVQAAYEFANDEDLGVGLPATVLLQYLSHILYIIKQQD